MKVAVTGARGFVGRHVLRELARRGVQVSATERPGVERARPAVDGEIQWVPLDLAAARGVEDFEALGRPDVLIHLAWGGLPNYRSLHHFETELPRHYAFLSGLIRAGLPALVTAGTCFEYGMRSGPLRAGEETRPENPYGFAKDCLRRQLQLLKARTPFRLTWARLFYMYGEGQPETSLLPLLRKAVMAGEKEFAMSGGEQLRDYLPVGTVARQLVDHALDGGDAGPVNICSGVPVSVRRFVEGWIAENNWPIALKLGALPYPDYEPMAFWGVPGPSSDAPAGTS